MPHYHTAHLELSSAPDTIASGELKNCASHEVTCHESLFEAVAYESEPLDGVPGEVSPGNILVFVLAN